MILQTFINACLINPASGYTRDEETEISAGIGGRLPSDHSPAYHKEVKKCKTICNSKYKIIELINTTTAWLKARGLKVKIRISGFKEVYKKWMKF